MLSCAAVDWIEKVLLRHSEYTQTSAGRSRFVLVPACADCDAPRSGVKTEKSLRHNVPFFFFCSPVKSLPAFHSVVIVKMSRK